MRHFLRVARTLALSSLAGGCAAHVVPFDPDASVARDAATDASATAPDVGCASCRCPTLTQPEPAGLCTGARFDECCPVVGPLPPPEL